MELRAAARSKTARPPQKLLSICLYIVFKIVKNEVKKEIVASRPIMYETYREREREREIERGGGEGEGISGFDTKVTTKVIFSVLFLIHVKFWHVFSIFCVHLSEKITKPSSIGHVQCTESLKLLKGPRTVCYLLQTNPP